MTEVAGSSFLFAHVASTIAPAIAAARPWGNNGNTYSTSYMKFPCNQKLRGMVKGVIAPPSIRRMPRSFSSCFVKFVSQHRTCCYYYESLLKFLYEWYQSLEAYILYLIIQSDSLNRGVQLTTFAMSIRCTTTDWNENKKSQMNTARYEHYMTWFSDFTATLQFTSCLVTWQGCKCIRLIISI